MIFVNKKVTAEFLKDLIPKMGRQKGTNLEAYILTGDLTD